MRSFGGGSFRGMGGGGSGTVRSMQMMRSVQRVVRAGTVCGGGGGAAGAHEPFSHTTHRSTSTTNAAAASSASRGRTTRQTTSCNFNMNQPITLSSTSSSAAVVSPCNNNSNNLLQQPTTILSSCSSPTFTDSDWECIDDYYEADSVFGTVPSKDEVHHAVFALQQVLDPASPKHLTSEIPAYGSDADSNSSDQVSRPTGSLPKSSPFGSTRMDWMEPSLQLCNQSMLQAHERVYDAFHLLQNEPSVQKMVISLSSDKAVWDAVLKNEVVQEIKESLNQDKIVDEKSNDGSHDSASDFLSWVVVNTKAKVMQLIDKITKLVNELFRTEEREETAEKKDDPFGERLRASFMLSVVIMLIVVVTRSSKA